jgi:hypothetical protein
MHLLTLCQGSSHAGWASRLAARLTSPLCPSLGGGKNGIKMKRSDFSTIVSAPAR